MLALREAAVTSALADSVVLDCGNYWPETGRVLPEEQSLFQVIRKTLVTPDDGRDYLGAIWSPTSDALVFVAPTDQQRPIREREVLLSDEETRLVAVSINELWLYSPERGGWEMITRDGARPVWSRDGQSLYYMAASELMRFDLRAHTSFPTGLKSPDTAIGILFSQPLPDGRLLAPKGPHTPLEVQGGPGLNALDQIAIAERDYVLLSPHADQVIVAYGANTWKGKFTPSITVLYHPVQGQRSLFKNCQSSALEIAWSPAGDRIAYPVHASQPEIQVYNIESRRADVLVRLDTFDHLYGLSWSPDGRFLAFTQGDGRSKPRSIWIVSADGMKRQLLVDDGMLPNWSPDGRYILYARPARGRTLDWYMLEIAALPETAGGQK
ncbi:MAG: hypothetical protein RML46_11515 [Anaerolineae bacterium]|nr:hypothetical protein [Anaerolineae bacterium]